jgi:single-strand DNA-binding protein
MANLNRVFLIGNLTRDPQLSYLPSGTPVAEFGLATNRRWRGTDGEMKEETCFIDCKAFGKTGETISQYLSKGRSMFVEGRLQFQQWTAQDGGKRSKHVVTVEQFQFLDSRRGEEGGGPRPDSGGPQTAKVNPSMKGDATVSTPADGDIPF